MVTFLICGWWRGLWMVERRGACQTFYLHLPSELGKTFVDCRVILFNRAYPERSVAARKHAFGSVDRQEVTGWECCVGKQGSGWLLKIPTVDFRLSFFDSQEGFVCDGWLLFGLRIAVLEKPSGYFPRPRAFEQAMVSIEVITDRRIRDHVESRGLSRVFHIPRSKTYILSVHAPLETVQEKASRRGIRLSFRRRVLEQIERDAGTHAVPSTTWLCPAQTNGIFSRVVCLCDLEELKPCLGDLTNHVENRDDHPTLTFFFRECKSVTLMRWPRNSVLLFAMLLDPIEQNVEYLGSVFTHTNAKLHVLCFTDLCGLDSKLENMDCAFFVWGETEQLMAIQAYQQTVEKVRRAIIAHDVWACLRVG